MVVVEHRGEEVRLAGLQLHDLLLDGALRDHAVDHDLLGLPDPVGAVHGLVLGGGVPPRVQEEAVVGLREVDAEAAGLKAHQEHRGLPAAERVEGRGAVPGAAVQVGVGDPGLVQPPGHDLEEARELAEHQGAVALLQQLGELLEEDVQLGGGRGGLGVHQGGVQGEHAQRGEGLEDREAVPVEVAQQPQDLGTLALQPAVVRGAVLGVEPHGQHVLELGWQLQVHVRLGAAQHERPHAGAQPGQGVRVHRAFDGPLVVLGEALLGREQPRCGQGQQRPQLREAVLHGGAGDGQAGAGPQVLHGAVGLGPRVLHELRLVHDHAGPLDAAVGIRVETEQGVGGQHHVRVPRGVGHRVLGAGQHGGPQRRREAHELGRPVGHHGGGGDHQERWQPGIAGHGAQHGGDGLHGLAQPHVVREDPAEVVLPQEAQPPEPLVLVGAQGGLQGLGHGGRRDLVQVRQRADARAPLLRLLRVRGEVLELLPEAGLVPVQGQGRAPVLLQGAGLGDQLAQPDELRAVQGEPGPVPQQHDVLAAVQGLEDLREGQVVLTHPHGDSQPEPVVVLGGGGGDGDLGGLGDLSVGGGATGLLDPQVRDAAQPRQPLPQQREGVLGGVGAAFDVQLRDTAVHGLDHGGLPAGLPRHDLVPERVQGPERQAHALPALLVLPLPLHALGEVVVVDGQHQLGIRHLRQHQGVLPGGHVHALVQPGEVRLEELLHPVLRDREVLRPVQEGALLLVEAGPQGHQVQGEAVEVLGLLERRRGGLGVEQPVTGLADDVGPAQGHLVLTHDQLRAQAQLPVLARVHPHLEPPLVLQHHGGSRTAGHEGYAQGVGARQDGPQQGRGVALHVQLVAFGGVAAPVGLGQGAQLLEPVQLLGAQPSRADVGGQVPPVDAALHPAAAPAQHGPRGQCEGQFPE